MGTVLPGEGPNADTEPSGSADIEALGSEVAGFEIIDLATTTDGQFAQVLDLLGSCLGQGYVDASGLERYRAAPDTRVDLLMISNNNVIAVWLAQQLSNDKLQGIRSRLSICGATIVLSSQRVGLLESVAVKPGYRGRRLGSILTEAVMGRLKQQGSDLILTLAWESGSKQSSSAMFKSLGFQPAATVDRYWYEDSKMLGYRCPQCGNPCECRATVFVRRP